MKAQIAVSNAKAAMEKERYQFKADLALLNGGALAYALAEATV